MHLARFTTTSYGHLSFITISQVYVQTFSIVYTYHGSSIFVAVKNEWTSQLMVERGVLQGDPCSPFMFNLCFNTLMKTLSKPEFKSLGYILDPPSKTTTCSWLQFADDAVIIASNVKNTKQLLNIIRLFVAWCNWADMLICLDKCSSFGMMKK